MDGRRYTRAAGDKLARRQPDKVTSMAEPVKGCTADVKGTTRPVGIAGAPTPSRVRMGPVGSKRLCETRSDDIGRRLLEHAPAIPTFSPRGNDASPQRVRDTLGGYCVGELLSLGACQAADTSVSPTSSSLSSSSISAEPVTVTVSGVNQPALRTVPGATTAPRARCRQHPISRASLRRSQKSSALTGLVRTTTGSCDASGSPPVPRRAPRARARNSSFASGGALVAAVGE